MLRPQTNTELLSLLRKKRQTAAHKSGFPEIWQNKRHA